VTLAASSNAKSAFLIGIVSSWQGFNGPLRLLLYGIIISASLRPEAAAAFR
jgi:hypothetical protein